MSTVRLVPLAPEHAEDLLDAMRDPEILRFTRTPDPMPQGWIGQWISRFDQEQRGGWAVLDQAGAFVGYAVTGPVDRDEQEVEVGYAIAPHARGRGIATEVLRQLTDWAFEQGMVRVTALISTENPASSRVAAKAGYTYEGVLRSKHHRNGTRVDLESWSVLPDDPRG